MIKHADKPYTKQCTINDNFHADFFHMVLVNIERCFFFFVRVETGENEWQNNFSDAYFAILYTHLRVEQCKPFE